jgi:transcriptional regulator with XRE-family HTH domain
MELWKRLENELNLLGENWRWLGRLSSVPESTLSRWRDQEKYPSVEKCIKMAQAVSRSVEYLVTGTEGEYSNFSEMTLKIAAAAERLDETGKLEALNLVQSLERLHPLELTKDGALSKTAT